MVRRLKDRLFRWFFQIENEVLVPFLMVGIIVILGFSVISYYNGYTMQRDDQKSTALSLFDSINRDLDFLEGKLTLEELKEKYRYYGNGAIRITGPDGERITGPDGEWIAGPDGERIAGPAASEDGRTVFLTSEGGNRLGWKLEYLFDEREFQEELLEKQNYVVVGAIAALMIIIQASIFISHNIARPIRGMSSTCREINDNKGKYRSYRFDSVDRRDEIGQLAVTFERLLRDMDNYTKMEYTSRMSASLAHEIKNPIAGIRSGIQLLQGRAVKEGDRMLCESMIKEIDRVTSLIMNLFTLSVKKESRKEECSFGKVIGEITLIYASGPESRKNAAEGRKNAAEGRKNAAEITTEIEEGLTGYLNENEFRQIIHNLLNNSLKAMRPGVEGNIRITGRADGSLARIVLSDNGKGMTPEELAQAMEPFYTKSINGIGLGLAIVKKLVEQNEGTMEIASTAGEGTSVSLTFYRREEDYEESFNRR